MFPDARREQFDRFDKNGDGTICGKQTPGIFNVIDNTANRP